MHAKVLHKLTVKQNAGREEGEGGSEGGWPWIPVILQCISPIDKEAAGQTGYVCMISKI